MCSNPFDKDSDDDEEREAAQEYQAAYDAEQNDTEEYPPENQPDGDD